MFWKRALLPMLALSAVLALSTVRAIRADDGEQVLTVDHVIPHISTMPAIAGQPVQLYARERVQAGSGSRHFNHTILVPGRPFLGEFEVSPHALRAVQPGGFVLDERV